MKLASVVVLRYRWFVIKDKSLGKNCFPSGIFRVGILWPTVCVGVVSIKRGCRRVSYKQMVGTCCSPPVHSFLVVSEISVQVNRGRSGMFNKYPASEGNVRPIL